MNEKIILKNELLQESPEVNKRLSDAGYTRDQIQVFYDVIAEELLPVIEELLSDSNSQNRETEQSKLESFFGGPAKTKEIIRQLRLWAEKNIDAEVLKMLSSSADGLIVLYHMMTESEPRTANLKGGKEEAVLSEKELKQLMQSPSYWRDKDASVISKVENGFKRLYDAQ